MRIERARATRKDIKTVLGLIGEASAWLRTKDTDQWAKPWPDRKARNARVLQGLKRGKTWIVWDGNIAAATVTIAEEANLKVWSECKCNLLDKAVYVHRLITAREYAGLGLGEQLIDWAGLRGHDLKRAEWIRIDVWASNEGLHNFYTKRGFVPCGRCTDPDYPSGALFQKPVAAIGALCIPRVVGSCAEFDLTRLRSPSMPHASVDRSVDRHKTPVLV